MKILIITPGYFPTTKQQGGAIEKLIDNYLEYNETVGNNIEVYSPKISFDKFDRDVYRNTKFNIIDKTKKSFKIFDIINRIKNKIYFKLTKINRETLFIKEVVKDIKRSGKENFYDTIIFENGVENINYFVKKIKTNARIVLHLHNDYLNIETKQNKLILKNLDEVWTVSNYIKERVDDIEYYKNKVKVLSNPLDIKVFAQNFSLSEQKKLKQELGIKNEFVFIYTGRVIPVKGVKELVQAFNEFNKTNKAYKLLIVGGDKNYSNSSKYLEELKNLANENVIFTGFVPVQDLHKYYKIANAQVVPSLWNEAFGLILLEGMYFNLPIIATNSGGMPEVCGDSAYFVERNNIVNELVGKMEYLVNNLEEASLKIKKYPQILKKYTLEKYCENFQKLVSKK